MKRIFRITLRALLVLFILLNIVSAFHAYKFTHYYEASEMTVKKKSGWDKFTDILFGAKYFKKPNLHSDTLTNDIILTTENGLKLSGWYNIVDSSKGTVILFHGHGGNSAGVLNEAKAFQEMKYNTLMIDFRAHGNSEGNTCTIGFDEAEDIKLAYDFIKNKGEKNIVLWGISLGAATITRAIYKYDISPQKIILELPFASVMHAVKSRVKMIGLPSQPISTLLTFWGGVENGFWAFDHKPYEYVRSIKCPVLLQFARNDIRVGEEEANKIFENITAPKQMIFYEQAAHESLCNKENQKWKSTISAFLQH